MASNNFTERQKDVFDSIVGGPRGENSPFQLVDERGALTGPFGLMVQFPDLGAPLQALGSAIRYKTTLSARAREIAILTVAENTESSFEAYAHRLVGIQAGLSPEEITALLINDFTTESVYEEEVRRLTVDLLKEPKLGSEEYGLSEATIVEVVTLVGYYRLLSQLMSQFGLVAPIPRAKTKHIAVTDERCIPVDLYSAASPDSPLVIYLHGGGWISGSRTDYAERFAALVSRGISVASIDYRLVTEASFPAQQDDIYAVVKALRSNENPIFVMGASAGALLGALAVLNGKDRFAGFIGLFGRYDLTSSGDRLRPPEHLVVPSEIVEALQESETGPMSPLQRTALLADVSPENLHDDVLEALSPLLQLRTDSPPMLLIHGDGDAVVDYRHSERLTERAHQLGVPCEFMLIPDANHEDPVFALPLVMDSVARFIHSKVT